MEESETIQFDGYKTQLIALKSAWGNSETYARQCVKLLDAFTQKSAQVTWNSKALESP